MKLLSLRRTRQSFSYSLAFVVRSLKDSIYMQRHICIVMPTVIHFEDIVFSKANVNEETPVKGIKATFMRNYFFHLQDKDLRNIGKYEVKDGDLIFFEREKRVWNKFSFLLDKGFENLQHKVRNKECLYIHENLGIPLLGSNEFGLIDRGSNIIEIKPLTGCNLSCTFCSVDEGVNNKTDIVVEEEFLVKEFKKLARIKEHAVEANIGPQGEPLLYPKIVELVRDLKKNGASIVSVNTNGTLLFPKLIDELADAGLDRINLSLHSLYQKQVNEIMGGVQNVKRLLSMVEYCQGKVDILLAPVLMKGINDDQLDELVQLAKTIKNKKWPSIGIQNFLEYKGGRNPGIEQRSWEEFFEILQEKEKEHDFKLTMDQDSFTIVADKTLPKPFRKGDVIKVVLRAKGRNKYEWLGVSEDRVVSVRNIREGKVNQEVKVKLLRDKHNIYVAVLAS